MSATVAAHPAVESLDSTEHRTIVMSLDAHENSRADASAQQPSGDSGDAGGDASAAARTVRVRYFRHGKWRWRVIRRV
jgi:hypothetical protein